MNANSEKTPGRRAAGIAGMLTFQLLVFFVLLEIVARIFDPIGVSYYDETARLFDEMIIEEPIGYRFPPGLEGNFYGVPVKINERGMRDNPVSPEKEAGEFRLLAMGDSVMFSVGVSSEDSIPSRIEGLANQNAPADRHYRVLNMGVPSYNTVQELEQLKQVGLSLQPDAAFLFIIPNDLEDKMWVYKKRGSWYIDLAQRSYAMGLTFYLARWVSLAFEPEKESADDDLASPAESTAAVRIVEDAVEQDSSEDEIWASVYGPGWMDIENSLVEISRLLKARGVPLMVFYRTQFNAHFIQRLTELGEQHGFSTVGIDPWEDTRWIDENRADYVNSSTDSHCNPAGCRIYAQIFYENMIEAGIIE